MVRNRLRQRDGECGAFAEDGPFGPIRVPPYWRTLGAPFVAYLEKATDGAEVLGCEGSILDCIADDLGNRAKNEPPRRSEEDGSGYLVRAAKGQVYDMCTHGFGLLSAPL